MYRLIYFIGILSLIFVSCKKEKPSQEEIDEGLIQTYIKDNNLDAIRHPSGLYYIITNEGTGSNPNYYSSVKVSYTGKFLNDTVFESSTINYYPLNKLIYGWIIGIPLLKAGGSGTFIVPSGLAYGPYGRGSIPGNAVLRFDLRLIDFK